MKVRMMVSMSGTRSGVDWPPYGGVLECSDGEGAQLCAAGIAEPAAEPEPVAELRRVETATLPTDDVEVRAAAPPEPPDSPKTTGRRRAGGS